MAHTLIQTQLHCRDMKVRTNLLPYLLKEVRMIYKNQIRLGMNTVKMSIVQDPSLN